MPIAKTVDLDGNRINDSMDIAGRADYDAVADASIHVAGIIGKARSLVRELRNASEEYGYVYEQLTNAADQIDAACCDELETALIMLNAALNAAFQ